MRITDLLKLRESIREILDNNRDKLGEETLGSIEKLLSISDCTAQNTTQHISAAIRGGLSSIGDGEGECADVVGNHSVRHVHQSLVFRTQFT